MHFATIAPAAGLLVSSAHAFLLPPGVSIEDIHNTLPVPSAEGVTVPLHAEAQSLQLDCPGCPLRVGNAEDAEIKTSLPSHIGLDFTIDPLDGVDHLSLNGFELYPKTNPFKGVLTAPLLAGPKDDHTQTKGSSSEQNPPLGYGLRTHHDAPKDSSDFEVVTVDLQIVEVGNVFVDGVPAVKVQLVKSQSGKLMIGSIEAAEPKPAVDVPATELKECRTMICRWKAVIMHHLGNLRTKHCGHHAMPPQIGGGDDIPSHMAGPDGLPSHMAGHHGHHAQIEGHGPAHSSEHRRPVPWYRHQHSWGQLLKNIASHILLPVAIGILAGVSASILGMLVGTFIVFLWRTFVRRSSSSRRHGSARGRGQSFKAPQKENGDLEEKVGLMAAPEDEPAPPAYLDASDDEDNKQPENDA